MTLKQFVFAEVKCSSYERCVCWPCSWPVKCIRWLMWPSVKWMGVNGSSWLGCRLGGASDCIKAETCSGGPNGLDGSSGSCVIVVVSLFLLYFSLSKQSEMRPTCPQCGGSHVKSVCAVTPETWNGRCRGVIHLFAVINWLAEPTEFAASLIGYFPVAGTPSLLYRTI